MCKLDWKSSLTSVIEKELGLGAQKPLWKQSQELDMLDHQEHLADLGHTSEGTARISPSSSIFRSESTQPSRKCRASEHSHASAQLFVSSAQGGSST